MRSSLPRPLSFLLRTGLGLAGAAAAALAIASAPEAGQATKPQFEILQSTDADLVDCGTYIHDTGTDPSTSNMRLFMDTDRTLYLRAGNGLKKLSFDRVEQNLRDEDLLGKGDTLKLFFKGQAGENASLEGLVVQAVIDDEGEYPLIELEATVKYDDGKGNNVEGKFTAHDMCI